MIHRKTAQLFQAGARDRRGLGDAPAGSRGCPRPLRQAHGHRVSSSIDDVLDYQVRPETSRGKNLGDDLAEGKPTLPLIHALQCGDDAQRALIREAITPRRAATGWREITDAPIASPGALSTLRGSLNARPIRRLPRVTAFPTTDFREGLQRTGTVRDRTQALRMSTNSGCSSAW